MNKISIYDVAKHAKVSQSTVSRVLNNYPYIKPATKEKVLKISSSFIPHFVNYFLRSIRTAINITIPFTTCW